MIHYHLTICIDSLRENKGLFNFCFSTDSINGINQAVRLKWIEGFLVLEISVRDILPVLYV